jgi:hypothetical protein
MKILILILLNSIYTISSDADLENFKNELCSFNGKFTRNISYKNNTYGCVCQDEYDNNNNTTLMYFDNKYPILCGYEKKRRFIALFFSVFMPIGLDYLYLGFYPIFVAVLLLTLLTFVGNFVRFAIANTIDWSYFKNKYNLIFFVMLISYMIFYFLNAILIATGTIRDSNGIDTVSDIDYFYNFKKG